jgi:predicted O-methyltransferase YrrM
MGNGLLAPHIESYLENLVPDREPQLQAMEARALREGFPIIGPACGHLCYLMARMTGARQIFELGSGFGYSTAWFAKALRENGGGEVHHVVWDEALSREAQGVLSSLGYDEVVRYHIGEAVQVLSESTGPYDLIFNDIDKAGYPASLPAISEKLRPGGVLIVDNMLWYGRIFDRQDNNPDTEGIREMTRLLTESDGWVTSLVPIRDGMTISLKK